MGESHTDVLIIGSGAAGCTAAIYAARANRNPIILAGQQPGGQLTITTDVENYPGFADIIQGPWLMEQMQKQAEHVGARFISDAVANVELGDGSFVCVGEMGERYVGKSLIIATGASARWLEIPSEIKFRGFGVSACATCDGFFFRKKHVAVIGGGNSAVEEAIYLTNHASKVTLIHRRGELRAEKIAQDRLFANPKVDVVWNGVVEEIRGEDDPLRVTDLRLRNIVTKELTELAVDGVFVAIGHVPNTERFKGLVAMDADGYIVTTPGSTITNVPGIYAAGDVQDKTYRQAVTAAGSGCMAALEAERYLIHHG